MWNTSSQMIMQAANKSHLEEKTKANCKMTAHRKHSSRFTDENPFYLHLQYLL